MAPPAGVAPVVDVPDGRGSDGRGDYRPSITRHLCTSRGRFDRVVEITNVRENVAFAEVVDRQSHVE